jgi:hypothetical protein
LRVVFSGSEENREEIGERWRVLDLDKESEEACVRAWVEEARDGGLEVRILSSAEHCACKTVVRRACGRVIKTPLLRESFVGGIWKLGGGTVVFRGVQSANQHKFVYNCYWSVSD